MLALFHWAHMGTVRSGCLAEDPHHLAFHIKVWDLLCTIFLAGLCYRYAGRSPTDTLQLFLKAPLPSVGALLWRDDGIIIIFL